MHPYCWGNIQQLKDDDQQELQARALPFWTLWVLPIEALKAYRTHSTSSNITMFSDRGENSHSHVLLLPIGGHNSFPISLLTQVWPLKQARLPFYSLAEPDGSRPLSFSPLCPFKSLCWGVGKHAASVCSCISDLFRPLQMWLVSSPVTLHSPSFSLYSLPSSQHLRMPVPSIYQASQETINLCQKWLDFWIYSYSSCSIAIGKLASTLLKEHCG